MATHLPPVLGAAPPTDTLLHQLPATVPQHRATRRQLLEVADTAVLALLEAGLAIGVLAHLVEDGARHPAQRHQQPL